jgi:hypothetical protein
MEAIDVNAFLVVDTLYSFCHSSPVPPPKKLFLVRIAALILGNAANATRTAGNQGG